MNFNWEEFPPQPPTLVLNEFWGKHVITSLGECFAPVCHIAFTHHSTQIFASLNFYVTLTLGRSASAAVQSCKTLVYDRARRDLLSLHCREDGLKGERRHWESHVLIREHPVVRKCSTATEINNFRSLFSLAKACARGCRTQNTLHGKVTH